ncbi:hypothetical protein LDK04_00660 [Fusobacterium vincentii]
MANDDITNEGLIDVSGLKNIGMRVTEGELAAYDKHEEEGGEAQAASAKPFAQGDDTDEDINIPYYSYKTPIAYNKKEIKLSSGEEKYRNGIRRRFYSR